MSATQATALDHRDKLAAVEREIHAAEADLDRAVATEDAAAETEQIARLTTLRTRRGSYLRLLLADEQAEADRLADARSKADRSARRALKSQLAAIERHAAELSAGQLSVRDSFRAMCQAAQATRALLPCHLRGTAVGLEDQLTVNFLRDLGDVEAFRLSRDGVPAPGASARPARWNSLADWATDAAKPLSELVGTIVGAVKAQLDPQKSNPLVAPYASERAPVPGVSPSPGGEAATGSDSSSPAGADHHHRSYVVDLRTAQPAPDLAQPAGTDPALPIPAPLATEATSDLVVETGADAGPTETPPLAPSRRRIIKYV